MAYARWDRTSDVYVYADARGGFTCERCPGAGEQFRCGTAAEMGTHLKEHRAKGQKVPDEALVELEDQASTRIVFPSETFDELLAAVENPREPSAALKRRRNKGAKRK